MPTASNLNQNPNTDIEDIFADADTGQTPPPLPNDVAGSQPMAVLAQNEAVSADDMAVTEISSQPETSYQLPINHSRRRRWLLIIAIVVGSLLLLGGLTGIVLYWLQSPSAPEGNTNAINLNQPPLDIVVNTNTPVNTNATNAVDTFIDADHDGLSDQEELIANTNPKKKDTDDDGLSDREEVRVYLTDPRNPDTDGDTYGDGVEVANFYHPNDLDPKKRLFDLPN